MRKHTSPRQIAADVRNRDRARVTSAIGKLMCALPTSYAHQLGNLKTLYLAEVDIQWENEKIRIAAAEQGFKI